MGYYRNIVSRFSIDVTFVMRPPLELVSIVTVTKYNLVIVTEFRFGYSTSVRFFGYSTSVTCFTSERIMLSFFQKHLFSQQLERGNQFLHFVFFLSSVQLLKLRASKFNNGQSVTAWLINLYCLGARFFRVGLGAVHG